MSTERRSFLMDKNAKDQLLKPDWELCEVCGRPFKKRLADASLCSSQCAEVLGFHPKPHRD